MTRLPLLLAAFLPALAAGEGADDLLRLSNGELEGRFGGLDASGVLSWEREDGVAPLQFKTNKVRQIVLRGGKAMTPLPGTAHVTLVNGDRIPAVVRSLDDDDLTLETTVAGTLIVPRDAVASLSPTPFGGRLVYAGPYAEDGWEIRPAASEETMDPTDGEDAGEAPEEAEPAWRHVGSKWYYTGGADSLRLAAGMPDRAIFRFTLGWRNRPPIAIAFHADFKQPEKAEGDDQEAPAHNPRSAQSYAESFGNAYVLNLRNSYATLHHCGFNEDGEPILEQIRASATNLRINETGEAEFEIRCDRTKGTIALYVDGEFRMQWNVDEQLGDDWHDEAADEDAGSHYAAPGGGIGFHVVGDRNPIRISNIIIAEWNGMPDSARSLESETSDVVLLTNGTDRFAGKVVSIRDGMLDVDGRYARLRVPLDEVAEIHFAREKLRETEESRDREIRVHFQPLGRLSGLPGTAGRDHLKLRSPLVGDLDVDLSAAVILEFQSGNSFLNYWDEEL